MSTQKALPGSPRTTSSVTSLQISTPVKAKVMYAVQQPLHLSTFDDVMGTPAWKSLPSWYLVAENDEVIPPDAERQFAQRMGADTIEVASGHCAMVYHPEETHERIVTAANAASGPVRASLRRFSAVVSG
jgi:pimeloyl-ACP methyl ester carboxylesterase